MFLNYLYRWCCFTYLIQMGKTDCFTVLSDCTVVLPPANSGGGKATTRSPFRVNFSEDYSGSLRFNNVITGTPTSVALPENRLFQVFKNEGERREQRGTRTQKDTGRWRRAVNCLNPCLFQKSFQMRCQRHTCFVSSIFFTITDEWKTQPAKLQRHPWCTAELK